MKTIGKFILSGIAIISILYLGHLRFKNMDKAEQMCQETHRHGKNVHAYNKCIKKERTAINKKNKVNNNKIIDTAVNH